MTGAAGAHDVHAVLVWSGDGSGVRAFLACRCGWWATGPAAGGAWLHSPHARGIGRAFGDGWQDEVNAAVLARVGACRRAHPFDHWCVPHDSPWARAAQQCARGADLDDAADAAARAVLRWASGGGET